MQITPGYDFSVNEVPTRAKLQSMLAGMSIAGINIDHIDTALIAEVVGDTAASMPLEGWLRIDPYNSLWVQGESRVSESSAQIKVDRANWGGWETRRFFAGDKTDTFPVGVGQTNYAMSSRAQLVWITTNNTLETNLSMRGSVGANTQMLSLKFLETGVSGYPARVLGRGGHQAQGTAFNSHPAAINANQTNGATSYGYVAFPFTSIAPDQGLAVKNHGSGRLLHWCYGAFMASQ